MTNSEPMVASYEWPPRTSSTYDRQRCTLEVMIREAKTGCGTGAMTSHHAVANRAALLRQWMAYRAALVVLRDLGPGSAASRRRRADACGRSRP